MKLHLHLAVIILILVGMLLSSCKNQSSTRRTGTGIGSQIAAELQKEKLALEARRQDIDRLNQRDQREAGIVQSKLLNDHQETMQQQNNENESAQRSSNDKLSILAMQNNLNGRKFDTEIGLIKDGASTLIQHGPKWVEAFKGTGDKERAAKAEGEAAAGERFLKESLAKGGAGTATGGGSAGTAPAGGGGQSSGAAAQAKEWASAFSEINKVFAGGSGSSVSPTRLQGSGAYQNCHPIEGNDSLVLCETISGSGASSDTGSSSSGSLLPGGPIKSGTSSTNLRTTFGGVVGTAGQLSINWSEVPITLRLKIQDKYAELIKTAAGQEVTIDFNGGKVTGYVESDTNIVLINPSDGKTVPSVFVTLNPTEYEKIKNNTGEYIQELRKQGFKTGAEAK